MKTSGKDETALTSFHSFHCYKDLLLSKKIILGYFDVLKLERLLFKKLIPQWYIWFIFKTVRDYINNTTARTSIEYRPYSFSNKTTIYCDQIL